MKRLIIAALVPAVVLFMWQFISFGLADLHGTQMQYTPNQDAVLQALEENLEPGEYFLPRAPMGASQEEQESLMNTRVGQPWAQVIYHGSMNNRMGMNMLRGFVIDFVIALIICWILMQFSKLNMSKSILACLGIGLIGYLSINYLNHIWFENNTIPDLIDAIVPWTLIGLWTGYYIPRS